MFPPKNEQLNFKLPFPLPSSSSSSSPQSVWDPTLHPTLNHPTLHLLERCTTRAHLTQILAHMLRQGLASLPFPFSRLLHVSSSLPQTLLIFRHVIPQPPAAPFLFTTLISALAPSSPLQSLSLYTSMLSARIPPDRRTLLALLKSPNRPFRCVHAHAVLFGLCGGGGNVYLLNSLIKAYMDAGSADIARHVFDRIPERDAASFNAMISGYACSGRFRDAFRTGHDMARACGVEPDGYTMVGLLSCCGKIADLRTGKSLHGWMVRRTSSGPCWGLVVGNALLDAYAKCGEMEYAVRVFDRIRERDSISWNVVISGFANLGEVDLAWKYFDESPVKDLVSWNSMLAGFARKGDFVRAMELFEKMVARNVQPDKVTAIALVSAAAEMGDANRGRCMHGWAVKNCSTLDAFLGSALIDMYCKCGSIGRARIVFETVLERDVAVWTAMVSGLAFHGRGSDALDLFSQMQEMGLVPNSTTLITVLTACTHAGLTDQGCQIFKSMRENYGVEPGVEHYGCLVDLLARSGKLAEASDVISRMPMKPSRAIWGAVLSASRTHGEMELAETALSELTKLEPEEEGGYILLSNVYALCRRWSYRDEVREAMGGRGIKKMAGRSSLVVDDTIHEFVSSDRRHPKWTEIYCVLYDLHREMKI